MSLFITKLEIEFMISYLIIMKKKNKTKANLEKSIHVLTYGSPSV